MAKDRANILIRARTALRVFRDGLPPMRLGSPNKAARTPLAWPDWRLEKPAWQLIDYAAYVEEGFNMNTLIYSAILYKVRAMTAAPLRAYRGNVESPEPLPESHPLAQLVARPNSHQSWTEFHSQNIVYLNVSGNAYIYMARPGAGGLPGAMYSLRPDRTYIIPAKKGKASIIGYWYVPEGAAFDGGMPILAQDMAHIKLPNPSDPLEGMGYGLSPISPGAKTIDVDNQVTHFLKLFFERGMMPNVALKYDSPLMDSDVSRIRERWMEFYGGTEGWIKPAVLDQGGSIEQLGYTFDQLGFTVIDERSESRILGPFGVPPILIGSRIGLNRATYSNYKEARGAFWEDTMVPETALFETDLQYYLQGDDGSFVKFDFGKVPAFEDIRHQRQMDALDAFKMSGITRNEYRRQAGLPEVEGGDVFVVSFGVIEIPATPSKPQVEAGFSGAAEAEQEADEEREQGKRLLPAGDKQAAVPEAQLGRRMTFERKQKMWRKFDEVATSWDTRFGNAAVKALEADKRALLARLAEAKARSLREKATIDWQSVGRDWETYFSQFAGDEWRTVFMPLLIGIVQEQAENLSIEFGMAFDVRNRFAERWYDAYKLVFAQDILETTKADISILLQQAMENGWAIPEMEKQLGLTWDRYLDPDFTLDGRKLTDEERAWFKERSPRYRREMIARTETIRASNSGAVDLYTDWGTEYKEWLATADNRTRATHLRAWSDYSEGGTPGPIPMGQSFDVGGSQLAYPGDPAGSPEETINCRCSVLPYMADFAGTPEEVARARAAMEAEAARREAGEQ